MAVAAGKLGSVASDDEAGDRAVRPRASATEACSAPKAQRALARAVALRVLRYLPLLLFFAAWEVLSRGWPSIAVLLPAPSDVVRACVELVRQGSLQYDILASLKRVGVALGVASLIGF